MSGVGASRQVNCPQPQVRLMSVKVDGTGTASLSGTCALNMSLTDSGTGDYLLTFLVPYIRVPEVVATPITDNIVCKVGTVTAEAVQILTENLSGSATDADFHVMVIGSMSPDQI